MAINRITEADVKQATKQLKIKRISEGKTTWLTVEYYNGWCHLHEVDADTESRHCSLRVVYSGTKRKMFMVLIAALY